MDNIKSISDFINLLEKHNELIRIKEEVSPDIEISKITDEQSKAPNGGKALLFENVKESEFPVATNLFGSDKRMSLALGIDTLKNAGDDIDALVKTKPPKNFKDFFGIAKKLFPLLKITPKKFKGKAPCQEVVLKGEKIDLSKIPVLKCWPKDGGKFVTLPLVFTKSPDSKENNLGMYRLQIYDKNTTGMHWHIHKDGAHFFNLYKEKNLRMPVAVAIGADPATIYASTAPLPRGIDELLLAGFLRKEGVEMTNCITQDLKVPAHADFVLEGYVDPNELRIEGPFGDHTGYYSLADLYPVFHLTAITHRKKPIYCATLVGPPPMEDCYLAKATERIFLPLLKAVFPEITDYFLPWEGVFHNIVMVSIKKEYPAHAHRLMSALWGQGQMSFCKSIVIVDDDIDPSNLNKIWNLFLENFDANNDILLNYGVLDALDHSSPTKLRGNKIGIDLTRRIEGEDSRPKIVFENSIDSISLKNIAKDFDIKNINCENSFCSIALNKSEKNGREILEHFANSNLFNNTRAFALFDSDIDLKNNSLLLWKIFNNTDAKRDIFVHENCVFIDATIKGKSDNHDREWPEALTFDV